MRKSGIALSLVILGISFLVLPISGSPPQTGTPGLEPPPLADRSFGTLKATTRMVVLDVMATDSRGNAITGLKPENFTILEDGKEQKIRAFQWQQPGATSSSSESQSAAFPSNAFDNDAHVQNEGARNVIVLGVGLNSDVSQSSALRQMYARLYFIEYVRRMPVNAPTAIFELRREGAQMLQDFTTDRTLLLEAAKKIKPRFVLQQAPFQGLQDFATKLAAYPGRKNLIWLTDDCGEDYSDRYYVADAISDGDNDGTPYYVLGYYPDNKDWNGAFRRIDVKVHPPGIALRHRSGYVAIDPEKHRP